jgi:hypothetical protein
MDGKAYCSDELWRTCLDEMNLNEINMCEKRYDCIIHLVTTADGAPEFYTLANN